MRTTEVVEVAAVLVLQRRYLHSVALMSGDMKVCRSSRPSFNIYHPLHSPLFDHIFCDKVLCKFSRFFLYPVSKYENWGEKRTVNGLQSPVICNCVAMENRRKLIVINFRRTTSLTSAKSESPSKS